MKTLFKNSAIEIILYYKGIILAVFFNDDNQLEVAIPFLYVRFSFGWIRIKPSTWKFVFGIIIGLLISLGLFNFVL